MNKRKYLLRTVALFFTAFATLSPLAAQAITEEKELDFGSLGKTKIQIVIPQEALISAHDGHGAALPVVIVVAGFQTSRQITQTMGETFGKNILIAYEYPLDDKMDWLDWSDPADTKMASLIPTIPLQIVNLLNWIRSAALNDEFGVHADLQKVNVVTISLGTFFVPMALRLAQLQGIYENSVVFAFGGAHLHDVVQNLVKEDRGDMVAQFLSPVIQAITSPFEPTNYLPDVHPQHFLILNALDDQIFTRDSQNALVATTPDPKEIISVPGVHIGLNQPERVSSTIALIRSWFLKNGALNP